jgi:hypothetical protein
MEESFYYSSETNNWENGVACPRRAHDAFKEFEGCKDSSKKLSHTIAVTGPHNPSTPTFGRCHFQTFRNILRPGNQQMTTFQSRWMCHSVSGVFSAFRSVRQGSINIQCSRWVSRNWTMVCWPECIFRNDFIPSGNLNTPNYILSGDAFAVVHHRLGRINRRKYNAVHSAIKIYISLQMPQQTPLNKETSLNW